MASTFPTALDVLTNPGSTQNLNSPSHSAQHANANDAIERLEAKVGITSQSGVSRGILFASSTGGFRNGTSLVLSTGGQLRIPTTGSGGGILTGGAVITGAAGAGMNFIGLNRTVTGAILNSGIAAFNLHNDGTLLEIERYTGGGVVNGKIQLGLNGEMTVRNSGLTITGRITSDGQLQLPATGSGGGIRIGGDVDIYRNAANVARTPDKWIFDDELEIDGALNHDGTQVGFYGVAPVTRGALVPHSTITATLTGADTVSKSQLLSVLVDLSSRVNQLANRLERVGLISTA